MNHEQETDAARTRVSRLRMYELDENGKGPNLTAEDEIGLGPLFSTAFSLFFLARIFLVRKTGQNSVRKPDTAQTHPQDLSENRIGF
jgi:hypothetical protein